MASTIKTRVLIISDTHCASLSGNEHDSTSPFSSPLPPCDILIHAGDLTHEGTIDQYHHTLNMLKEIDAPVKLVIAGNHDLSLDRNFVLDHMRKNHQTQVEADHQIKQARDLWTAPDGRAQLEGVTFLDEGVHSIPLNNGAVARVYASPYTPEFCDWGFPYGRMEDRFNEPAHSLSNAKNISVNPIPSFTGESPAIDILITHGPPFYRLDRTERGDFAGCPHLLRAVMRSRPLLHCFGHIHEGWGAERITWSPQADTVATSATSVLEWRQDAGKAGMAGDALKVTPDTTNAQNQHAVFLDASQTSGNPLNRGEETLIVNAAIMDIKYAPRNAPFVVDLDLPRAG